MPEPLRTFLLGQPLFLLTENDRDARWRAVISDAEPIDARRKEQSFRSAHRPTLEEPDNGTSDTWQRLDRETLVRELSDPPSREPSDPPPKWQRGVIVCGAGLGKTTNLQWLEAEINRFKHHGGKQLAFFLELDDLPASPAKLLGVLGRRMKDKGMSTRGLKAALQRRQFQGRITLLLDSLDQASPERAISALTNLLDSPWKECPIWVTGRPHAFDGKRSIFLDRPQDRWQFLRVGELEEPESRFLMELTRIEMRRRRIV